MLNTSEIFSTINMIKDQKLDIRTMAETREVPRVV